MEKCCHFFDLMNLIVARSGRCACTPRAAQDVNHLDERYDGETPDIIDNAFAIVDYDGRRARAARPVHVRRELAARGGDRRDRRPRQGRGVRARRTGSCSARRDGSEPTTQTFEVDPAVQAAGAHHGSTFLEHRAFIDAIRAGGPPAVSAADGALAVAVGAAAERSARERRPVELRELGF